MLYLRRTRNKDPHTLPLSDYLIKLLTTAIKCLPVELAEEKSALVNADKLPLNYSREMVLPRRNFRWMGYLLNNM